MFLIDADIPKLGKPRPGTHVGRVLTTRRMTAEDLAEELLHLDARIHTDGTLFDAMRHATWTMGGPDQLVPFDPDCVVEPKWERRLARVGHPVLRDHLRMLCLDAHSARYAGAHYVRARHRGFGGMRKAGGRVVAAGDPHAIDAVWHQWLREPRAGTPAAATTSATGARSSRPRSPSSRQPGRRW
jgi:hypothetical protein